MNRVQQPETRLRQLPRTARSVAVAGVAYDAGVARRDAARVRGHARVHGHADEEDPEQLKRVLAYLARAAWCGAG